MEIFHQSLRSGSASENELPNRLTFEVDKTCKRHRQFSDAKIKASALL